MHASSMIARLIGIAALGATFSTLVEAQPTPERAPFDQISPDAASPLHARPRIGLVLAGGGAKGAAHIGVLRVLEDLRVPVDCVVGTSMGALVGAVFASGVAPADIEASVRDVDWSRTVGGQGRRDRMPIHRKLSTITYSNSFELGLKDGRLRAPGGLVVTQEIEQVIRTLVANARYTRNFDELTIPFRAVATDMVSGDMVILNSGDLAAAMRASMAIPGVFSPVVLDGRVLADGGMTRNLPVDIARSLCADVVIAVWTSTPSPDVEGLSSALSLVTRSIEVMIAANEQAQIATLRDTDVGIEVPMETIGTRDFQRVPEAIDRGRMAATASAASLSRYSVSEQEYRTWTEALDRSAGTNPVLADVQVVGTERVNPDYVRSQIVNVSVGSAPTVAEIGADVERVYALGDFDHVDYELTGSPTAPALAVKPVEKPWGPNFFRFDGGVSTYEGGDIFAILRLDHERTWINSRGGEWHNALQIGRQSIVTSDFYQPFDVRQRFFVQPILLGRQALEDLYLDGDRVARYKVNELYGQVDVGMNVGSSTQLRFGLRKGEHEAILDTGLPGLPEGPRTPDTSLQLRAVYDTRDTVGFPTRGTFWNARYVKSSDWLNGKFDYSLVETVLQKAFPIGEQNSLALTLAGEDTLDGELPITQQIEIGGIRTFPGLRPGELRGDGYWSAGTAFRWRIAEIQPLFGQALYAGVRFQAAKMRHRIDVVDDGVLYGLSGSLGGRTPLGTFLVSLGYVEGGSWELQFTVGRPVAEGSILDEVQ